MIPQLVLEYLVNDFELRYLIQIIIREVLQILPHDSHFKQACIQVHLLKRALLVYAGI